MRRALITTYLGRASAILSALLVVPIVINGLGIEGYAIYALASSFLVLFSQDLGGAAATTSLSAQAHAKSDWRELRRIAASAHLYFIALAIGLVSMLAIALPLSIAGMPSRLDPESIETLTLLACAAAFLTLSGSSNRHVMAGSGRLDVANYVVAAQASLRPVTLWAGLAIQPTVVAALYAEVSVALIGSLASWLLRRRFCPESRITTKDFDRRSAKMLWIRSWDLLILTMAATVILQAGTILTSLLLPLAAVAAYAGAQRAFLLVREAANSLVTALLPTSSTNSALGRNEANATLFLQGTKFANSIMLLICAPIGFFSPELLYWWGGPSIAEGTIVCQILVASMLINNNHLVATPILIGMGRIRAYAMLHLMWAASALLLGWMLGSHFGVGGIAIGMTLPLLVLEPVYVLIGVRRIGLGLRHFLKTAILIPWAIIVAPATLLLYASMRLDEADVGAVLVVLIAWFAVVPVTQAYILAPQLRLCLGASRLSRWARNRI